MKGVKGRPRERYETLSTTIRLEPHLAARIDREAARRDLSRNAMMTILIEKGFTHLAPLEDDVLQAG